MRKSKKVKQMIIEELKMIPIINHVCKKVGISRATFYRWCAEDRAFAQACEAAFVDGESSINDLAETQLILKIKQGEHRSIVYWLSHHKKEYKKKDDRGEKEITWTDVMLYMNKNLPDDPQYKKDYEEFLEYRKNKGK